MSDLITMLSAASGAGGGAETDPYFNQTTLLLHGDGTNGAQNNTFLDSSTNTFTITRNGNTTQGTFSPFSEGWSNYFDGSGDFLQLADSTAWDLTGDYTIEMWLYKATGTSQTFFQLGTSSNILLYQNASNQIIFYSGSAIITASTAASLNTWNHVALVRNGGGTNNTVLYLNGVNVGQATNTTSFTGDASNGVRIGAEYPTGFAFNGYISNVSVLKTAKYTGAFTPSTAPLNPSETNQELLTCYSNRFVDANTATTSKTITANGNVAVQPFSPFAPSAAYNPSVNGGSGYFDGTGDYLTVPDNPAFTMGSGNFSLECWYYPTSSSRQGLIGQSNAAGQTSTISFWLEKNASNQLYILVGSGGTPYQATSTATIPLNAWSFIQMIRDGNTLAGYINGTQVCSVSVTGVSINDASDVVSIGGGTVSLPVSGYISNARILKGVAASTTIPTTPPTSDANTSLLLSATNTGIFDNTGKNVLETVGNAQIDTATKKYGTGSMEFDGTGDALKLVPNRPLSLVFGASPFTIEAWIYIKTSLSNYDTILARDNNSGADLLIRVHSTGALGVYLSSNGSTFDIADTSYVGYETIVADTWCHIAVTKDSSNTVRKFINGERVGTSIGTLTSMFDSSKPLYIGQRGNNANYLDGYVDDLRITIGPNGCRYTDDFTPPTAAFPDQ